MESGVFQQNMAVLRSTRPAVAAMVEAACPDPKRYRLTVSSAGFPILEYIQENGRPLLWHSRYEPQREAEHELSVLDRNQIYFPLLGGMGLGYSLRELWDNHRSEFFDAVILEPDVNAFRLAMENIRLDDIFADPRLHVHLGTGLPEWMEMVKQLIPSLMSCTLRYLPHRPTQTVHAAYFQAAISILQQRIQLAQAEFDLLIRSGLQIQQNMWLNLPSIASSIPLNGAHGLLQGKPAVVIAAGPSLDKNVDHLRGMEDSLALIAVDTAFRTLQQRGIVPHVVVTTDPTELNARHFEGVSPDPRTILAFDPEVHHAIPAAWPFRKMFLNLEKAAFTRWIESALGPFGYLPKGGSVGHTAFYLARELGADPILFAGLDLAFDPYGGATHTTGSALYRTYDTIPQGAASALLGSRMGAGPMQESIVWVPGAMGGSVPTSRVMALYIQQFAEEFARTSARLIDATEGGALLAGTEIVSLRDAIRAVSRPGIGALFERLAPIPPAGTIQTALRSIEEALDSARVQAGQGLELALYLTGRIGEGTALRGCREWIAMEEAFTAIYHSEEIRIALEQSLFSAVYTFIQKERAERVDLRRAKYEQYFREVLDVLPRMRETIQRAGKDIQNTTGFKGTGK